MSKPGLKRINYRTAVACNMPLFLIPIIALLFWYLGAYRNDDGYDVAMIVTVVGVFCALVLAVSVFLLAQASKERRDGSNEFALWSTMYGIWAGIWLGGWLLFMEPKW